jgi:hypothetical protein
MIANWVASLSGCIWRSVRGIPPLPISLRTLNHQVLALGPLQGASRAGPCGRPARTHQLALPGSHDGSVLRRTGRGCPGQCRLRRGRGQREGPLRPLPPPACAGRAAVAGAGRAAGGGRGGAAGQLHRRAGAAGGAGCRAAVLGLPAGRVRCGGRRRRPCCRISAGASLVDMCSRALTSPCADGWDQLAASFMLAQQSSLACIASKVAAAFEGSVLSQ